jgi:hypothetical protein
MVNQGTSLDMSTSGEPVPETQFVKNPDTQMFGDLYDPKMIVFVPGDAPNESDVSYVDDENDLSFSDVTKGLSDLKNKIKDVGKGALEYIGIAEKEKELKPINTPSYENKTKELAEVSVNNNQNKVPQKNMPNDRIKNLQSYFKNPDANLRIMLNGKVYNGPVDGHINNELMSVASTLETSISRLLNTDDILGVVLRTDSNDVKEAVAKAAAYKDYLNKEKLAHLNFDQRFYVFSKMLSTKK